MDGSVLFAYSGLRAPSPPSRAASPSCRLPPNPELAADPKVVAFYQRLRERQLRALGLDPADFKTVY